MKISFSPQRSDRSLTVSVNGDSVIINGQVFAFDQMPEGAFLPADAIESDWFVDGVTRIDGEINITVLLPHGNNPSNHVAFPFPVNVANGIVPIPKDEDND